MYKKSWVIDMKKIFIPYKLFFIVFSFWLLITYNFSLFNITIGFLACIIVIFFSKGIIYDQNGYLFASITALTMLKYSFNLLLEIYKSSFSYIARIIKKDCQPLALEVELDVSDPLIISIISNSITLTPGTITINVQGNKLTILTLKDCQDPVTEVGTEIKEKFQSFFIEKG